MPPLRSHPATDILTPLSDAFRTVREGLKARVHGYHSDLSGYWNTVLLMMQGSDQTMRAAHFLVGDDRLTDKEQGKGPGPFPAQAVVLQRGLIEGLANVLALSENRVLRDLVFRKEGYRESAREYLGLRAKLVAGTLRQRKNSQWKVVLDDWDEWLTEIARALRLTPAEVADPTKLPSWPRPPQMLQSHQKDPRGAPWVTGNRLEILRYFHDESYGSASRIVHQKDRALYLTAIQARGMTRAELERVRNIVVLRAATLHAAIVTEVGFEFGWSKDAKQRLRTAWAYLIRDFDPALEAYELRYRPLLARRLS